jgi:hypothetical protein
MKYEYFKIIVGTNLPFWEHLDAGSCVDSHPCSRQLPFGIQWVIDTVMTTATGTLSKMKSVQ